MKIEWSFTEHLLQITFLNSLWLEVLAQENPVYYINLLIMNVSTLVLNT